MKSFFIIFISILLYGGLHSVLASHALKERAVRLFGSPGQRYYRIGFVLLAGLTLVPILWMIYRLPSTPVYTVTASWRWLMLALQAGATVGMAHSVGQTGLVKFLGMDAFWQPRTEMNADHLVTGGYYRFVRHPIYSFTLLFLWLMPWMSSNWLGLASGSTLYILLAIPLEERKLLAEFGTAYRDYQQRVPALFPFPRLRK